MTGQPTANLVPSGSFRTLSHMICRLAMKCWGLGSSRRDCSSIRGWASMATAANNSRAATEKETVVHTSIKH